MAMETLREGRHDRGEGSDRLERVTDLLREEGTCVEKTSGDSGVVCRKCTKQFVFQK